MTYLEKYTCLKNLYNPFDSLMVNPENGTEIHNLPFDSKSWCLLPGADKYVCDKHDIEFAEALGHREPQLYETYPDTLKDHDFEFEENRKFNYTIIRQSNGAKSKGVIFLLHGLNEKTWDKYLPWAEKLVELTGKAVILFPIAFHMNRAPKGWGDSRLMHKVASSRQAHSPSIMNSTFANSAISSRIQTIPQRFFWSGLQTFFDVEQLITEIRSGEHALIDGNATIDLFSYSIGSFLSEILLMSNPQNYFSDSRLFIFCGGPTLDRMLPNSKFILDSDATIALYSFYTERLDMEIRHDKRMAHYFMGDHPAGRYFKAMLNYHKEKETREERLKELFEQICAVALKKDSVIPPYEVTNTLKGENRDIPVNVEVLDFPYPYDHITPFPAKKELEDAVDRSFNKVFEIAASHLG